MRDRQLFDPFREHFTEDLLAGVTGAVAGAPQAMGFAIVAGINPIYGLYTAVVATIVGALAGDSKFMTTGPTNAVALVVGTTLVGFDDATQIERLFVLTLLVGLFQLGFGLLRLGDLTRFVSNAVMTGFITGAGLLIMVGQLRHMTGYAPARQLGPLPKVWDWLLHIDQTDPQTLAIGIVATVIIARLHRTRLRNVATLTALIVTSLFVLIAGWDGVETVREISAIPNALPAPVLPEIGYAREMLIAALAIAVLASAQSATIANAYAERSGWSMPNLNRDLAGQGLANIVGSFFQGMPVGGSLSRTAVNVNAGAQTRLANIFAGVFVAIFLIALAPVIERIALAALAGHLIVAAASIIHPRIIMMAWNVNWMARASMVITFASTLALPLEYSVYVGVALSVGLYVYTSANTIQVKRLVRGDNHHFRVTDVPERLPDAEPVIITVSGNLFFAAVKRLEELMPTPRGAKRPVVILRLRDSQSLGSTGIRFLEAYDAQLRACGGLLILTGVNEKLAKELQRTRMVKYFGEDHIFRAEDYVFDATEHAMEYAARWLEGTLNT